MWRSLPMKARNLLRSTWVLGWPLAMSHTTLSQMLKESHEVVVDQWPLLGSSTYQTQLVFVLLRMREFWHGPLASICIVSHGKGQVTYTRNMPLKQLQNGWTMLQILCRTARQKMRNLKPLAKITLPYDNAQDEKNCVYPHLVMYYGTWAYL